MRSKTGDFDGNPVVISTGIRLYVIFVLIPFSWYSSRSKHRPRQSDRRIMSLVGALSMCDASSSAVRDVNRSSAVATAAIRRATRSHVFTRARSENIHTTPLRLSLRLLLRSCRNRLSAGGSGACRRDGPYRPNGTQDLPNYRRRMIYNVIGSHTCDCVHPYTL